MRNCTLLVVMSVLSFPVGAIDYAAYGKVAASVVRVMVRIPQSNRTSFGSGVVLPDGRIATNCHVIPGTGNVMIMEGAAGTESERGPSDPGDDLCVLNPLGLNAPRAQTAAAQKLKVGDEVVAIGFGGGAGRSMSSGHVTALYPYHNGRVIQTDAAFRPGASGGGLFDRDGNLVGITTFFRRNGAQSAYFAIPVEWVESLSASDASVTYDSSPFWMRSQNDQPRFLQVASYEADGNWTEMEAAARLWMQEEPDQAQPVEALERAIAGLGYSRVNHGAQGRSAISGPPLLDQDPEHRRQLQ
jgi:serine protease Do